MVQGMGFEPTDLCRTRPSTLRRWPSLTTPALIHGIDTLLLSFTIKHPVAECAQCSLYHRKESLTTSGEGERLTVGLRSS